MLEVDLGECKKINTFEIKEPIAYGQRVRSYRIEGLVGNRWETLIRGTSIGHKELGSFASVATSRVRLIVEESEEFVAIQEFGLYNNPLFLETAGLAQR